MHEDRPEIYAVCMNNDSTAMAGQKHRELLRYRPPGLFSDPVWLLDATVRRFGPEGNLVVPWVPLYEWGPDPRPDIQQLREFLVRAATGGWEFTDAALRHGSGWVTLRRAGQMIHLCILSMLDESKCPLFTRTDSPADIADALARYRTATGTAWRAMAGVTGHAMIRQIYDTRRRRAGKHATDRRPQPLWLWRRPAELDGVTGAGEMHWERPMTAEEKKLPYVHHYDIRAARLAATGTADLGWSAPEPTGACSFDPERYGLWRIVTRGLVPPQLSRKQPLPWEPARTDSMGRTWVTTPVLKWMDENRLHPEIIDSFTCDNGQHGSRILRQWAEALRNALVLGAVSDHKGVTQAIKDTYTYAVGLMDVDSGRIYRPDWRATIVDQERINLLRKLHYVWAEDGAWPLQIETDSVWYADADESPQHLGNLLNSSEKERGRWDDPRIGKFKHEETITMAEYQKARKDKRR